MLRHLPKQLNANVLVGFDSRDDAGVYVLPNGEALVQTIDFFTPVVDDPYSFGQIAAANALSDVYAMGGRPLTALNVACFDPTAAPSEVWAAILQGMAQKTMEAGAVVLGGHSVEDDEPKFGMAVTGIVMPDAVISNRLAKVGQVIGLSKPLGSGIVTTAAKFDKCSDEELSFAIETMSELNGRSSEIAVSAGVRCGTDITGFGLVGHLWNIARESQVRIEVNLGDLPLMLGVERMVREGCVTGGSAKNRGALGGNLVVNEGCDAWRIEVAVDPQTSGGLAVCHEEILEGYVGIGRIVDGDPAIVLLP